MTQGDSTVCPPASKEVVTFQIYYYSHLNHTRPGTDEKNWESWGELVGEEKVKFAKVNMIWLGSYKDEMSVEKDR